jgi:hypothetical protein
MASSGIQLAQADAPPLFRGQPTKPALCKVTGACLSQGAIARELATFTIEAYDETGKRQTHGGDNFLVAIRGRGAGEKVRAKIIDNQDGSYAVGFKPITSGKYLISVSLLGEPLADSPFLCLVSTRTASAPHCVLRGKSLLHATARKEEMFELEFRDAQGRSAHAEEIDVFVEICDSETAAAVAAYEEQAAIAAKSNPRLPETSPSKQASVAKSMTKSMTSSPKPGPERGMQASRPRGMSTDVLGAPGVGTAGTTAATTTAATTIAATTIAATTIGATAKPSTASAKTAITTAIASDKPAITTTIASAKPAITTATANAKPAITTAIASAKPPKKGAGAAAVQAISQEISSVVAPPTSRPPGLAGFVPLLHTFECLVTSRKPLVVRSGLELESEKLGQLYPGQRLTLLECVHTVEDGQPAVRASVALADENDGPELDLPGRYDWRDAHVVRPQWLESVPTPRAKSPKSPGRTPRSPGGGTRPVEPPLPLPSHENGSPFRAGTFAPFGHYTATAGPSSSGSSSGRRRSSATPRTPRTPNKPSSAQAIAAASAPPSSSFHASTTFHASTSQTATDMPKPVPAAPAPRSSPRGRGAATPRQAIGWVTVHKGGRELVTPRGVLPAGERQQHQIMWARRIAVDRRFGGEAMLAMQISKAVGAARLGKLATAVALPTVDTHKRIKSTIDAASYQSVYANELASDPKRIGFAFGGVDPGRLHAHGQIVEVHNVHYSIAMCGTYRLHVALRHEGVQLPGSPFVLKVSAGPASALTTAVLAHMLPMRGVVGNSSESGCRVVLKASDMMGNACEAGGATIVCSGGDKRIESRVVDNNDGTYLLVWRSKVAGVFDAHVSVDGVPILGSPMPLTLTSEPPDLKQSELIGSGLTKAVAGKPADFRIKCKDRFGNAAQPSANLKFEMAMLPPVEGVDKKDRAEKTIIADRWKSAVAHPIEGTWHGAEFEVKYVADVAGDLELHVWCCADDDDKRVALPLSPFEMHCAAGRAHARGSSVEGFTRLDPNAEGRGKGAGLKQQVTAQKRSQMRELRSTYEDSNEILAGEPIVVRPRIRDKLGNNTAAAEGALSVTLTTPEGTELELMPNISIRSGLTNYDVRYEPQLAGRYAMHVRLAGAPIAGSPVDFECIPNLPDIGRSSYELPTDPECPVSNALFSQRKYSILLTVKDRCGNRVDHGGAAVAGRLQSANLPPQQEALLEVEDHEDGTYDISLFLKGACDPKVIISLDKDRQGEGGGEFAPIAMSFVSEEALKTRQAKEAQKLWQLTGAGGALAAGDKPRQHTADEIVEMALDEFQTKGTERAARRGQPGERRITDGSFATPTFSLTSSLEVSEKVGSPKPGDTKPKRASLKVVLLA